MSLQTQINSFVLRVAEEFNTVKGRTGTLSALTSSEKKNPSWVDCSVTNSSGSAADSSEINLVVYR